MGYSKLMGVCRASSGGIVTLRKLSLAIRAKRVLTMVKGSNDKGSALLGVVKKLRAPATKMLAVSKGSVSACSRTRVMECHESGMNFI